MESLYNFDPNRNLGFDAGRGLDFDGGRTLDFRPSRDLSFTANRDLGFGARGVVFRSPKPEGTPAPRDGEMVAAADAAPEPGATGQAGNRFCPYCGVEWRAGQEVCWNCRSRIAGGRQVTRMPARAAKPMDRAWRGAGEG